jgi:hypothetical protein
MPGPEARNGRFAAQLAELFGEFPGDYLLGNLNGYLFCCRPGIFHLDLIRRFLNGRRVLNGGLFFSHDNPRQFPFSRVRAGRTPGTSNPAF